MAFIRQRVVVRLYTSTCEECGAPVGEVQYVRAKDYKPGGVQTFRSAERQLDNAEAHHVHKPLRILSA